MKKPLLCSFLSSVDDFSPPTPQIWSVLCYRQNSFVVTFLTEDVPLEVSAYAHLPTKHVRQGDDTGGHHQQDPHYCHRCHHCCHRCDITFSVCLFHFPRNMSQATHTQVREMSTAWCDKSSVTLETNPILLP